MMKSIIFFVFVLINVSLALAQTPQDIQKRSREIEERALAEKKNREQDETQKIELQRQRQWNEEHPGVPYPRQSTPVNSPGNFSSSQNSVINRSREIESRALTEKCQREQADFQTKELQRERQWLEEKPGIPYPRQVAPACGNTQNNSVNSSSPQSIQTANVAKQAEITDRSREIEARALTEKCLREQTEQRAVELQRERQWIEEKPGIPYPRKPVMICGENKVGNELGIEKPENLGDANNRQQNTTDEAILRKLREAREKIDEAERMIRNRPLNLGPQSNNTQTFSPQDDILRRSREIQAQGDEGNLNEQQSKNRNNRLSQIPQTIELNSQSPFVNRVAEIDPLTGNPKKKNNFNSNDLRPEFLGSYLAILPDINTRY
jgi:hypothetical protein